jgi:preprotein translocase subunit SecF
LFGGESIRNFSLAMIVGIGIGTWSSIVIASNFLLLGRKKETGK